MTERIKFLREETLSSRNKIARRPMPALSVAEENASLPVRKALAYQLMLDTMPLFIGEKELIVGTRTYFTPHESNTDGHSVFDYTLSAYPKFIKDEEIERFGGDYSRVNKQHRTPDLGILLHKGIGGIIADAEAKKAEPGLEQRHIDFLDSVIICYTAMANLIRRYSVYAGELAEKANETEEKARLEEIARVCGKISMEKPENFREAVQLLWFGHLGTMLESFLFICYGRLDVVLGEYLQDTPHDEAQELLECLLLKMYDQADINDLSYINKHEGQLVVTLGGVLPNGENAVNDVSLLFLDAIGNVRLPEPEFNLRISRKNPPEFLDKAAALTVTGCNFVSYYNDDLFVDAMVSAGLPAEEARCYGFDLCQDMNVPGKSDVWRICEVHLAQQLMALLTEKADFESFEALTEAFKQALAEDIRKGVERFNADGERMMLYRDGKFEEYFAALRGGAKPVWDGRSPMCPLPYLSGMYHGAVENATDMIYESYPMKFRGGICGTAVEAVNSLAAIKKVVFEDKLYTLEEVVSACKDNYKGEGRELMRRLLWKAPKWGNDDDYVDSIAKDVLEFCLREFNTYRTFSGGEVLGGIHQPHPVSTGWNLMATPEGRHAGAPVAVTMTPESGTMQQSPTAALKSASVFDPMLIQWNYCVMINYYASVFAGPQGKEIFKKLLLSYFARGGMQHQPNVLDVEELKRAQLEPEKYKDLIVRLWGVSAHFVDLPRELQDEMIARLA